MPEWLPAVALEIVFLGVGFVSAFAVLNHRVKSIEQQVAAHLSGSDAVKEDLVRIKVYLRLLLAKSGIDTGDEL